MATTTRPRRGKKAYDSVELKPLADAQDEDDDDNDYTGSGKSKTDKWLIYAMHKLHALLWIVISSALAIWTQLFEVVIDGYPPARPDAQLNRCALSRAAPQTKQACVFVHTAFPRV